jgi:hypothetical protein
MQTDKFAENSEHKVEKGDSSSTLAAFSTSTPSPNRVPLVLDVDSAAEEVEAFAREDIEQEIQRHQRRLASRTLFHELRGDDDTV